MDLLVRIKRIILCVVTILEISMYNEFTIEDYFRKKGLQIRKNNRIFIRNFGSEPYLIKIGNHSTYDGGSWIYRNKIDDLNVFGKIEIKDNCFIGLNAIILPNVTIGPNSVVRAGSVVSKDVPPIL